MSLTKMHLSGHIWCRWCGCVFQFGHLDKCLKIKPYWSEPLLCHDKHGFWKQLTLKVMHGPDRTERVLSHFAEHATLKTCFARSVFMAVLRLRLVATREEKICCTLVFHVLKHTPNICPCTTEKFNMLLSFKFYFCHPCPWKSSASQLNLANKPIENFFEQIQLTPWHFNDQSTILNLKQYLYSFIFICLLFGHIGCWGHLRTLTNHWKS